jgi:hypothetical protein
VKVSRGVPRARRDSLRLGLGLVLLLAAPGFADEPSEPPAEILAEQRIQYDADEPKTILELQPFRTANRAMLRRDDGTPGVATLVNLNPYANAWYLLLIDWQGSAGHSAYHLENPHPLRSALQLRGDDPRALVIAGANDFSCALWASGGHDALAAASSSALPYAPLCSGALYLRNPVAGHHTPLERITDFLRDHVWGGDRLVNFVKEKFYRDAFLEKGVISSIGNIAPQPPPMLAPLPASVAPEAAGRGLLPRDLALDLATAEKQLQPGQWYSVRDLGAVSVSVITPQYLEPGIRSGREPNVNVLDPVESGALVYLVAFDLQLLDLHFVLGTDHPRLDWSERPPLTSRDPDLPGPDGVASAAPLVTNGMVSPADTEHTIATFTGGFKRSHGAFRVGPLAEHNHGSHYGFIEQGVIFSKLQPGLATAIVMDDGAVDVRTWSARDNALLPHIRSARQNGVPLIEYDAARGVGVPGELVNLWGPGNWSGSAEEVLRTLRAGLCLQENGPRRFLIYGYFSAATPSAMARVFQAYHCRYAMHLDMNALEHTYLALYVHRGHERLVEHLIQGMEEVDRSSGGEIAPRFLSFPDDRDFFYVTRREAAP